MKALKGILLALTVVYLVGVVTGPLPESTIHDPASFRLVCFLCASVFGALYYGLSKKLTVVWKPGWLVIAVPLTVMFSALSSSTTLPYPQDWLASAGIVIGGGAAFTLWALWWKRQKSYFGA